MTFGWEGVGGSLSFIIDHLHHSLSGGTEHSGVDVSHCIVHGVPSGSKARVGIVAYDVDARDTGNLVDGEMIIGDLSTLGIGEPLSVATGMGGCPHLVDNIAGEVVGQAFAVEAGIAASYHIEEDAEASHVAVDMGHAGPVLRAETPGDAVGGFIVGSMLSIVLGIEEDYVDTDISGMGLQLAGYFFL